MQQRELLTPQEAIYLKKIGLSNHAIRLYELLLLHGELSAQEAAVLSGTLPAAVYRLFYELEARQLVLQKAGRPKRFEALALNDGLQASLQEEEQKLRSLIGLHTGEPANIIIGRQKVYDIYNYYARRAQHQICIYAIGIAYDKELAKTQAGAVSRGVNIRHIVQEIKPANYYVISRWLKLGIGLRILKSPRGYHLTIIDDTCAIVTFSNPQNTDDRVSMMTANKDIIKVFQAQFEGIWSDAKVVPPSLLG